jgi:hypothetical protein
MDNQFAREPGNARPGTIYPNEVVGVIKKGAPDLTPDIEGVIRQKKIDAEYSPLMDKAEAGKTDIITRNVLSDQGFQPRYPNPTDAQVMGGINQAKGRALFDKAEAGKIDIITRQIRELNPYQQWWYDNAEGVATPRTEAVRPQAEYVKPVPEIVPPQSIPQPPAQSSILPESIRAQISDVVRLQNEVAVRNNETVPDSIHRMRAVTVDEVMAQVEKVWAEQGEKAAKKLLSDGIEKMTKSAVGKGVVAENTLKDGSTIPLVDPFSFRSANADAKGRLSSATNFTNAQRWKYLAQEIREGRITVDQVRSIMEPIKGKKSGYTAQERNQIIDELIIGAQTDRGTIPIQLRDGNTALRVQNTPEGISTVASGLDIKTQKLRGSDGNLYGGLAGFEEIAKRMGFKGSPTPEKGSVRAGISLASDAKESVLNRGIAAGKKLYTDAVDKYSPIQNEAIRFEKETGIKLSAEENPYDRAHVAHTSSARAEMMVREKGTEVVSALKEHYNLPHEVTLKTVMEELPKGKLSERLVQEGFKNNEDAFGAYLVAKRQMELQKIDPEYIGPIDPVKAAEYINTAPVEFSKAAESFYKYNDNLLQIAVDNGLVTPELAAVLRDKYKNYAAMSRDFSDVSAMDSFFGSGRGMVNVQGVLKRIKDGSERSVVNPLESAAKNTYIVLSKVERNRAGQAVANLAEVTGGDYFAKKTTESPDPNKSIFSVFEKGEKVNYQTTPELYRALTAMNEEGVSSIVKILSYPTGWLRAGATLDPGFFVKNSTRDAGTAAIYSKYGFVPLYDTVRGMADIIGNKKLYAEYRASGAQLSVITGMDRPSMAKAIASLNGKELWSNYNPVELLREMTGFFENSTRIREFQKARDAGEGPVGQARAAQEVTLNFTQRGAKGAAPNQLNAFLNAQIQGVAKMIQEHKNNPARTAGRAAMYITAPSIGLWVMNHDDVRYQELPAYQRDLFWIVPTGQKLTKERFDSLIKSGKTKQQILDEAGALIRIPKPFELGIVYGSLFERFLDYAVTKDPAGMKRWTNSALTALTPNLIPTVAAPIIENITNHSFFTDRPIVPRRKETMPPKLQYTERTSELAKGLGSKAEAFTAGGISPAKIDNAISGYFGGLGKSVIDTAEVAAQLRSGKTSKLLTEQPVFRAFFITPFRGSESVQTFYEKLHIQSQYKEAYDKTKTKDPNFDPRLYLQLDNANKAIKELNKKAREIDESSQPADKKRKMLDNINLSVLAISRNALKK